MSSFFKSISKEANLIARDVGRGVDDLSRNLGFSSSPTIDQFLTGNVLQLVSRSSGKALQIVVSPNGQLVVDGMGPVDPSAYHAHWTVVNEGNRFIRLHNKNNYLAVVNGSTLIVTPESPSLAGAETKLKLVVRDNYVLFESSVTSNQHIGILPSGHLKSAAVSGRDMDSQFGTVLVYSPYPQQAPKAK